MVSCNLNRSVGHPDLLSIFLELEHYPTEKEENACEALYVKHTRKYSNGRFIVTILFKGSVKVLGDSYDIERNVFFLER